MCNNSVVMIGTTEKVVYFLFLAILIVDSYSKTTHYQTNIKPYIENPFSKSGNFLPFSTFSASSVNNSNKIKEQQCILKKKSKKRGLFTWFKRKKKTNQEDYSCIIGGGNIKEEEKNKSPVELTSKDSRFKAAEKLMKKRGEKNLLKAMKIYKELLNENPESELYQYKWSEAVIGYMRTLTFANTVKIDGLSDTAEAIKMWKKYSPEVHKVLRSLSQKYPDDATLFANYIEAFAYLSSSKGIVKAAAGGDGFTFLKLLSTFANKFPKYDNGVAYIMYSAFYIAAPWPLRHFEKAKKYLKQALEINSKSRRNLYYNGMINYRLGDYDIAAKYFEKSITAPWDTDTARDLADFLKVEANRALNIIRKEKGE